MPNEILLLDHPDGKILAFKAEDGTIVQRTTVGKNAYVIPVWCGNATEDHACAWGCMGISRDLVSAQGREYCQGCEFYQPSDDEERIDTSPVMRNADEWIGVRMANGGNYKDNVWDDESGPRRYPCVAVVFKQQFKNKFGNNEFLQRVRFVYLEDFDLKEVQKARKDDSL